LAIALIYAPLAFVVAVAIAAGFRAKRNAMVKIALWSCAAFAALLFLAVLFHFDLANWLVARLFFFAIIAFIGIVFDGRTLVHTRSMAVLAASRDNAGVAVVIGSVFAGILFIWPLLAKVAPGAAFGDAAQILHFSRLGYSAAAHLSVLTVLLDAVAGACLTFALLRRRNVSTAASLFAAVAWSVAGARIAPQGFGFQATMLVPAALILWPSIMAKSRIWFFVLAMAVAIVSPQIFVPMLILIAADNYSSLFSGGRRFDGMLAVTFVLGCGLLIAHIALFPPTPFIVGPLADSVLRVDGGYGAYPWEWLYPSPVCADFSNLSLGAQSLTMHFGNAWQACVSCGWAVLLLALAAMGQLIRRRAHLGRFVLLAGLASMYAALPSHIDGIPIPDLALVGPLMNPALATGAYAGVAGVFALCVLSAFEIDWILQSRKWHGALLAYVSLVLLILGAPMISGILWNPDGVSLTNQLRGANYACGQTIGLVPGYAGDDPVPRTNRLSVLAAFGSLSKQSPIRSMSSEDVSARSPVHCFVVDYDEQNRYSIDPTSRAVLLPASLSATPVEEEPALDRYMLPGFRIVSLDDRIFVYRRLP